MIRSIYRSTLISLVKGSSLMPIKAYVKRYILLWGFFIILFFAAALGLELIEGYKITTTEYHGLRNLGVAVLFMMLTGGIMFYFLSFLPLTILLDWLVRHLALRLAFYMIVGAFGGLFLFIKQYGAFLLDGRGYHLNALTPCLLFGIAGLLYGIGDYYFKKRIAASMQK